MRLRAYLRRTLFLLTAVVLVAQIVLLLYVHVYANTPVPTIPELPQTTYLFDRDGILLTTLHGEFDRVAVDLDLIPKHVRQAIIATEDQSFYGEGGVSVPGMMRAALFNISRRSLEQGGSTITQQFVKNAITGSERSFSRKIREAILAQKISEIYSKDEILAKYLNSIYFGRGAYGIHVAAQTYFDVEPMGLSVLQAATLAGLVKAPELFDPVDHPKRARERRNVVLDQMATEGYISEAEADALKNKKLRTAPREIPKIADAPYFVDHVRRYLQTEFGTDRTFHGGLTVRTTLDRELQTAAETAVESNLGKPGEPAAAIVAIEPSTGAIRAMVGGSDFKKMKFNLASQGRRQTGSAFKAFTLATAIEQGIGLDSVWSGPGALTVGDPRCAGAGGAPWTVHNYGDATAGTMTLSQATASSVNTIYAQLATTVGPDAIVDMAHRMGVTSDLQPVCSITLGSQPVSPLEMTSGFATLAARGVYRPATPVERVTSSSDDDLYLLETKGKQVLEKKHADLVTYALQGVIKSGTGTAAKVGRPAAGKTGTAQNYQDAWFCGYVPQLAACVWVGYPEGAIPMLGVRGYPQVFGGSIPADIWRDFMDEALRSMSVELFVDPFGRPESSESESVVSEGTVEAIQSAGPSPTASPTPSSEPSPTPKPSPTDTSPQPLVTITP